MGGRILSCVMVMMALGAGAMARGETVGEVKPADVTPTGQVGGVMDTGELDSIIARLSDADYQVREGAAAELEASGPGMLDEVLARYPRIEDAEARLRVRAYLRSYFRKYVKVEEPERPKPGFLGVALNQVVIGDESLVRVGRVVTGTTAERMGLRVNDVIVSFQGREVGGQAAADAAGELVREIQSTEAGTEVRLGIRRAGQAMELKGVLDVKPVELMNSGEQLRREAEEQARRNAATRTVYDQWWSERLGGESDPARISDEIPWEDGGTEGTSEPAILSQQ